MYKYLVEPCLVFAGYCQLIARTVEQEVESDAADAIVQRTNGQQGQRKTDLGSAQEGSGW